MDGKTKAIIAHLWIIGWVIALVLNSQEKSEYASFYIRQTLGIMIAGLIGSFVVWIPIIGWALGLAIFVFWVISLINSTSGEEKPVPVVGELFQEWFAGI